MAQYFWSAEDYALDTLPPEWAEFGSVTALIKSDGTRKYLEISSPTVTNGGVTFIPAGDTADASIYAEASLNRDMAFLTRAAPSETVWARGDVTLNSLRISVQTPTFTSLASASNNLNDSSINKFLFRTLGTSWEYAWSGPAGSPAYGSADSLAVTTSSLVAAGKAGVLNRSENSPGRIYSFGIGTNGDPAPTGPASTGTTGTADHQASTATHSATGSASSTITGTASHQALQAVGSGAGQREVTGATAHQAQSATHSSSGSVGSAISGTASHQASPATHSATAEREITGTSNSQAARATHSATGLRVVTGDAVHQAGAATHSAQGAAGNAFVGSGDHQAQTSTHAATGTRKVTGTSASQAQTATHNATAVREIIGNGTQAANDATHSSTGTISRTITGTASHQAQRATHQASSRPVLLRPIKNTSLVEVTPDYSTVDISPTYTIAVQ